MKKIINTIFPKGKWRLPILLVVAVAAGVGAFIFKTSNAISYMSDDPKACINCHVMVPHYATWQHSSHRERAVCNDCHVPQHNILAKYAFKAQDGMRHATKFTLRLEPQVLAISESGRKAVQQNCVRCHEDLIKKVTHNSKTLDGKNCWDCHREVPHGRVHSLSATPYLNMKSGGFTSRGKIRKNR